jgi:hypothetical protein
LTRLTSLSRSAVAVSFDLSGAFASTILIIINKMETELWLHEYRKLEKEKDLMRFASSASTPWADSRLKFKRNFLHIL